MTREALASDPGYAADAPIAYEASGCGCRMPSAAQTPPAVDIVSVLVLAVATISRRATRPTAVTTTLNLRRST